MGLSTPLRDELAINDGDVEWQAKKQKGSLSSILGSLPKPSNDYQLDVNAFTENPDEVEQPDGFLEVKLSRVLDD